MAEKNELDLSDELPEADHATRALTRGYMIALSLIALLSIVVHLLLEHVIAEQSSSATVVNVSGRQRMLSQRIVMLADDYHVSRSRETAARLEEAVDLMERSHQGLMNGSPDLGLPGHLSAASRAIYLDPPHRVDQRVRQHIAHARALLASSQADQAPQLHLQALREAARGPILAALDAAVRQFERESIERIERLRSSQKIVLGVVILTLVLEALFIFRPLVQRVKYFARRLYQLATTDPLTRSPNRRQLLALAQKLFHAAKRHQRPLVAMVLDIDHFKTINDRYGHDVGDAAIRHFAQIIQASLRQADFVGRWGGDEFIAILPEARQKEAMEVAERVRKTVAEMPFIAGQHQIRMEVCAGVGMRRDGDLGVEDIIQRADRALLDAKSLGRNSVILAE
jgi:diguanylate cyclase (GGDEF)-like protein